MRPMVVYFVVYYLGTRLVWIDEIRESEEDFESDQLSSIWIHRRSKWMYLNLLHCTGIQVL